MNAPSRVRDQLRLAAGIRLRHPVVPLVSTACFTAYVFGSEAAPGTRWEAALAVPGVLLLFGLPVAQRLWFLSAVHGEPMSIVAASKVSAPVVTRLIRLVCLVAIPILPTFLLAGAFGRLAPRVGSGFFVIPVLAVDVSLTFVLPALILSTRSAVVAIRVGFLVSRQTWPASASYVLAAQWPCRLSPPSFQRPLSRAWIPSRPCRLPISSSKGHAVLLSRSTSARIVQS